MSSRATLRSRAASRAPDGRPIGDSAPRSIGVPIRSVIVNHWSAVRGAPRVRARRPARQAVPSSHELR